MQMKIIGDLLKTASQNEKFKKGAVIGGIGAVGTVAGTLMLKVIQHQKEKYGEDGYNGYGYDRDGYDREGYNEFGLDREGYQRNGYNWDGYDREGYKEDGYNDEGYKRDGYNGDGYDREGYNKFGLDREGYNRDGYNAEGYNRDGYNAEGYDREGYNSTGFNKQGYDRNNDTKQDIIRSLQDKLKLLEKAKVSLKADEYEGAASRVRNVVEDICDILLEHYLGFTIQANLKGKVEKCIYWGYIEYEKGQGLHKVRARCNDVVHETRDDAKESVWRVKSSIEIVKEVIQYLCDDFQRKG